MEKRRALAREFVTKYAMGAPEHIVDIVLSVLNTRDGVGPKGGSFAHAVVANDLHTALNYADVECRQYLHIIDAANAYCWER